MLQSSSYATGRLELLVHLNNPASNLITYNTAQMSSDQSCRRRDQLSITGDRRLRVQRSTFSAERSELRSPSWNAHFRCKSHGVHVLMFKELFWSSSSLSFGYPHSTLLISLPSHPEHHKLDYAARTGSALSYHIMIGLCLFDIPVGTPRAGSPLEHSYFERNFNRHMTCE